MNTLSRNKAKYLSIKCHDLGKHSQGMQIFYLTVNHENEEIKY